MARLVPCAVQIRGTGTGTGTGTGYGLVGTVAG